MSPSGNATGNTARFSGGFASSVTGGAAQSGNATGNIVHLSGGIVLGSVVGGYIDSASNATGNTVIVSDAADIKHVPLLYGGYANQDPGDIRTGNTLHLDNWTGGVGAVIKNFEHYRFTLPAGVRGGQNILPVIGSGSMDLGANARISVDFSGSPCAFKVGEEINLINTRSASGVITGTLANTTAASTVDGTTYTFRLALTDARDSGYRLLTATLIGQKRQSSVAQKRKRASVMRKRD
jgi:hypothetical protein